MLGIGIGLNQPHSRGSAELPLTLTSATLAGWWDPSDSDTVTLSGSDITNLADKSGNGMDAAPGTTQDSNVVGAPALVSAGLNGLDYMEVGNNEGLLGGAGLISDGDTPVDIFIVVKKNGNSNSRIPLEVGNAAAQTNNEHYRVILDALGSNDMYVANIANDRATANGTFADDTWYIMQFRVLGGAFSSSNPEFYLDNVQKTSTQGAGTGTPDINATGFSIGHRLIGSSTIELMDFGDILIYEGNLDAADTTALYNYLSDKWNVG